MWVSLTWLQTGGEERQTVKYECGCRASKYKHGVGKKKLKTQTIYIDIDISTELVKKIRFLKYNFLKL